MRASNGPDPCRDAREHYYDLLSHNDADVPEVIKHHVAHCPLCRQRIARLGEILAETQDDGRSAASRADRRATEVLHGHFEWLGEHVVCRDVRAYLPDLLRAVPTIRIPTPITVHIDQCPPCRQDLDALQELNLTADQLARLSRLYLEPADEDPIKCARAEPAIAAVGSLSLGGVEPETRDHLARCPHCRIKVYRHRQRLAGAGAWKAGSSEAVCPAEITAADVFDYVVPCGAAADADAAEGGRTRLTAHLRTCPACMEKLQAVHCAIYGILERTDSGIATVYEVSEDGAIVNEPADDVSARYPVRVQFVSDEAEPATRRGACSALAGFGVRPSAKVILVVAAVVVLAILFLMNAPSASGTGVGAIFRPLGRVPNVHVAVFSSHSAEPAHETWVARDLDMLLVATRRQRVLYDLHKGRKRTLDTDRGETVSGRIGTDEYWRIRRQMVNCAQTVLQSMPPEAQVRQLPSQDDDESGTALTVYEVIAPSGTERGVSLPRRWRILIDPATGLPQRIESFHQDPMEDAWRHETTTVFDYLTERQMEKVIATMFPPP